MLRVVLSALWQMNRSNHGLTRSFQFAGFIVRPPLGHTISSWVSPAKFAKSVRTVDGGMETMENGVNFAFAKQSLPETI